MDAKTRKYYDPEFKRNARLSDLEESSGIGFFLN